MKRKALLAITGCTAKAFETYSARGFLPFGIQDARWSEYTLEDAFLLRLLMDAASGTDQDSAALLARGALDKMSPITPFSYTGDQEMWAALIRYDWPNAPEGWDQRHVVAGRWQDIEAQAKHLTTELAPGARVLSIQAVSATKIAHHVFRAAREFGLPEGEHPHAVPEDLTGYPEWFKEAEMARRRVVFGISEDRAE